MVESLLSVSGINLFGHFVIDLQVVNPLLDPIVALVASAEHIPALIDNKDVNGVPVANGDRIVVWKQRVAEQIELYTVHGPGVPWTKGDTPAGKIIQVTDGDSFVGYFMKLENGFETPLHLFAGGHFAQRLICQVANNLFDERFIGRAFDYLHQLQRGLFQFHALRGRFVKRAVDNVRPLNQITQRRGIESEFRLRHIGNEFSARLP